MKHHQSNSEAQQPYVQPSRKRLYTDVCASVTIPGFSAVMILLGLYLRTGISHYSVEANLQTLLANAMVFGAIALALWWLLCTAVSLFIAFRAHRLGRYISSAQRPTSARLDCDHLDCDHLDQGESTATFPGLPRFMLRLSFALTTLLLGSISVATSAQALQEAPHPLFAHSAPFHPAERTATIAADLPAVSSSPTSAAAPAPSSSEEDAENVAPVPLWTPRADALGPGLLASGGHRALFENLVTGSTVVVEEGESLWHLAAKQLGPGASQWDIAQQTEAWYQHNRERIGTDPNLIRVAQTLLVPPLLS